MCTINCDLQCVLCSYNYLLKLVYHKSSFLRFTSTVNTFELSSLNLLLQTLWVTIFGRPVYHDKCIKNHCQSPSISNLYLCGSDPFFCLFHFWLQKQKKRLQIRSYPLANKKKSLVCLILIAFLRFPSFSTGIFLNFFSLSLFDIILFFNGKKFSGKKR